MKIQTSVEKVNQAIKKILEAGGRVKVDGDQGAFSIKGVEGRFGYDHDEGILVIVIDDKPWLAPDAMIEKEIRKFFN